MTSFLSRRGFLAAAAIPPLAAVSRRAGAQAPLAAATAPVAALDNGLLAVMKAGKVTPFATRMAMFTPVAGQAFDLNNILAVSVGPRFASFSPQSQADLLGTFTEYTAASYVANFDSYNGERFEIAPDIRKAGVDDVVQTRIVPLQGEPTRLDYVVRMADGPFKIVDVLFDGSISRVAVQRSDFRSLLESGSPAPLIEMLRSKITRLSSGTT